jgi:NAD(P)-dependent dehydrogenase (short-subunit alcohol dehydrogenase family)
MIMKKWDTKQIPDLAGKVAIITGGNTGLGFQSSLELARNNATVIIACRTISKGENAIHKINQELKRKVNIEVLQLDLTNQESIDNFSKTFHKKYNRLDILMNNAGIVNQKHKGTTKDGFETQMGTNHLGHFLLTGKLLELILKTPKSRVVTMSSGGYKGGNLNFSDLHWENRKYHRVKSYGDSKLANLLFTLKLQQLFENTGNDSIAISAHPGLSASPRQQEIGIGGKLTKCLASPLWRGVRPQLLAATANFVKGNQFFGPKYGIDGPPKLVKIKHKQYNQETADKLWEISEILTGFKYDYKLSTNQ